MYKQLGTITPEIVEALGSCGVYDSHTIRDRMAELAQAMGSTELQELDTAEVAYYYLSKPYRPPVVERDICWLLCHNLFIPPGPMQQALMAAAMLHYPSPAEYEYDWYPHALLHSEAIFATRMSHNRLLAPAPMGWVEEWATMRLLAATNSIPPDLGGQLQAHLALELALASSNVIRTNYFFLEALPSDTLVQLVCSAVQLTEEHGDCASDSVYRDYLSEMANTADARKRLKNLRNRMRRAPDLHREFPVYGEPWYEGKAEELRESMAENT